VQEVWKHSLSTLLRKSSFVLALPNLLLARCTFYSLIASTYDEPGKPFSRLLAETGCTAGENAVLCLQQVPFNVSKIFWPMIKRSQSPLDSVEYQQPNDFSNFE
jgi:hypothetical protein